MIVQPVTVGALFCEDIREEVSGALTLVGVLPDNLAVPEPPVLLPKLAVFVRISIAVADFTEGKDLSIGLHDSSGERIITHEIEAELVSQTIEDARNQGSKVATFFSRLTASPFPIVNHGRFEAFLDYGHERFFAGSIKFVP